jgi:putative ATP-binding cassette transporter
MIPVVPLLFAAPKYFAGELSLGEVVQLAAAFVQVQLAISWIVDNYNRLAEWFASARRVMDIVDASDDLDTSFASLGTDQIRIEPSDDHRVKLDGVTVTDAIGRTLVFADELTLTPGSRVHVYGSTSAGKSLLVRAMAALWPWGRGRIAIPQGARLMVVPQDPYLPMGTLRHGLLYPDSDARVGEAEVLQALADAGLSHLSSHLDRVDRWDQVLGNGERQRLCLARVLIHRPDVVVLDDALAALDEVSQERLETMIATRLPGAVLISLDQRARPGAAGTERYEIVKRGDAASLRAIEPILEHVPG